MFRRIRTSNEAREQLSRSAFSSTTLVQCSNKCIRKQPAADLATILWNCNPCVFGSIDQSPHRVLRMMYTFQITSIRASDIWCSVSVNRGTIHLCFVCEIVCIVGFPVRWISVTSGTDLSVPVLVGLYFASKKAKHCRTQMKIQERTFGHLELSPVHLFGGWLCHLLLCHHFARINKPGSCR